MISLVIGTKIGLLSPSLTIVRVRLVPGFPLMMLTASSIVILSVDWSLILSMMSLASTPALSAGVPSIGAMIVKAPSLMPIVIPSPPNSPSVCIFMFSKCFSSRKDE